MVNENGFNGVGNYRNANQNSRQILENLLNWKNRKISKPVFGREVSKLAQFCRKKV